LCPVEYRGCATPGGLMTPKKTCIFMGFCAQKTISSYSFDRIVLIFGYIVQWRHNERCGLHPSREPHSVAASSLNNRHCSDAVRWRSSIRCCQTTPLEQSSYTRPSTWFVFGHLPPQTVNVFNCWRHQCLVTVACRRCVQIFLLNYLLTYWRGGEHWQGDSWYWFCYLYFSPVYWYRYWYLFVE